MAVEVNARKLAKSWQYDFKLPNHPRERKGGYRTRQQALVEGRKLMDQLETGACQMTLEEAYNKYMASTKMKDRSIDCYKYMWNRIEPVLGHYYIEKVDTSALDLLKQELPKRWEPSTINQHLSLVRIVLGFMWQRGKLKYPPYVPKENVPKKHQDWYTEEERDRVLTGVFQMYPQWYLFFYLTCRLGLRRGEVYGISHRQIRHIPPQLIVDQQVQMGTKIRPAKIITRKNNDSYTLQLTQDVIDAISWHIQKGYAENEFLFSKKGRFPTYLNSHVRPLQLVQRELGLRELGHHAIGRHSVASQAATGGESIKAIQSQLGHKSIDSTHKYAHLGSKAQLRVVESLVPTAPPHAIGQI